MQEQDKKTDKPTQVTPESGTAAALKDNETPGPADSFTQVRPAGANQQADKPRHWDEQDERSDESFPASDPPSTY